MKILGLSIILLSTSFLCNAATWKELGSTNKVAYEYDQETIKTPYRIWVKTIPLGNDFPEISKVLNLVEIACVSDKYNIHKTVVYNKAGEVIDENEDFSHTQGLTHITPDTVYDNLHKIVCTKEFM